MVLFWIFGRLVFTNGCNSISSYGEAECLYIMKQNRQKFSLKAVSKCHIEQMFLNEFCIVDND